MILAADIGATNSRLGLFRPDNASVSPVSIKLYRNREFPSLDAILADFLSQCDGIKAACFGVAGPVIQDSVTITNLQWDIHAARLRRNFPSVALINDVEALGYGIPILRSEDLVALSAAEPDGQAPAAVIAAGTGLGEAVLRRDGVGFVPLPSEAGHTDFAPGNAVQVALLQHLWSRFTHVSWDRILSGPGLVLIYEFVRDGSSIPERQEIATKMDTPEAAAIITEAALKRQCELCVAALNIFVDLYGAEAGNLALRALARSGVYIGGGIAPRIVGKLRDGCFMKAFVAKGRMITLLQSIPVYVIMNDQAALFGAARYAAAQLLR